MKIWVDADACPVPVREILFRAAQRIQVECILVANTALRVPPGPWVKMLQVPAGFDVADNEIVKRVQSGDLVVTSDIPLAAEILAHQAHALSPRGERYHSSTIKSLLSMRDLMDTLRASGIQSGGQNSYSQTDRKAFADQLDKILQQNV
ncbi:MAG: YaiI/YqxD family protein [Candidatus Thioglobus sp.]|nr:MAG: YaiI/YqxD family protein [Candidatus Thioglobus sp.]|tara:strand:- start:659 stop:1105 length:447 start_codon:yes stop_codon:yes gene_type:complete